MGKGNEPTPSWRWCKCHKVIKCRINSEMLILDRPLRPNLCTLQPSILCSISNFPHERGKFKNGEKYAMWIGNLSFLPWYPDCSMPKNASGIHEMRCISPSMWCDAWKLERDTQHGSHTRITLPLLFATWDRWEGGRQCHSCQLQVYYFLYTNRGVNNDNGFCSLPPNQCPGLC